MIYIVYVLGKDDMSPIHAALNFYEATKYASQYGFEFGIPTHIKPANKGKEEL